MPLIFEMRSLSASTSRSSTAGSGPSSEMKIGRWPSDTSAPGIGASPARIASSTCFCERWRWCGFNSWIVRSPLLRAPLPVSPTLVEIIRTSGIARTTASTCRIFSLPRSRLVPTGMRTFMRM